MRHYYGDVYHNQCDIWASPQEIMQNYDIPASTFIKWATMRRNGELAISSKIYYDKHRKKLMVLFNEEDFLNVWHDANAHTSEQLFEQVHNRSMLKAHYFDLMVPKIKGCFHRLDGLPFYVWDQEYVEALCHGNYI